jgi:hypothetical protein
MIHRTPGWGKTEETTMTTNETTCDNAAAKGRGLHYQSRAWASLAGDADWTGMWPAIDRDGKLTGQAVDSDETAVGWLNVDDEAMIPEDEARAGGWTIDADEGRAEQPVVARHEERDAEGTGWYVYVGGEDAGGPFETEADALEHWRS